MFLLLTPVSLIRPLKKNFAVSLASRYRQEYILLYTVYNVSALVCGKKSKIIQRACDGGDERNISLGPTDEGPFSSPRDN